MHRFKHLHTLLFLLLIPCRSPAAADTPAFQGRYFHGKGDIEYLRLLDTARCMFAPDPEFQNLSMLYMTNWNGLVEGPTWDAWWIQNSYGTTYGALPFLQEPFVTFLQNSQDLWFDQMGDGKRVGAAPPFDWVAPDGALCDAARPGWVVYRQGDGRTHLHDWGMEFTAAGLLMQSELLLISRDPHAVARYLPKLERCANFIESRRNPTNNLFLAGPAGNLLAPSYAGWKKPDNTYDKAYLTGLSVTYIAALDRLVELEKLAGRPDQAKIHSQRRDSARDALAQLSTDDGYLIRSLDPDGTRHGVFGAAKHGYFEASPNHDAIAFRVVDDAQARRIYARIASIPGLRPHRFILPNYPSYDDMYEEPQGLWAFGTWVNGGHWSTCEARMMLGYYRLGEFEDARASMQQLLSFATRFRMDNPLVKFGSDVYQPNQPINLTYDALGPPAAFIRGLFEYLYRADSLTLLPHIPPGITRLEQRFPIRFGSKRLFLATVGSGPITAVTMNGKSWTRFDTNSVFLPYDQVPETAAIEIALGNASPLGLKPAPLTLQAQPLPASVSASTPSELQSLLSSARRWRRFHQLLEQHSLAGTPEAAHARLAINCVTAAHARFRLLDDQKLKPLADPAAHAAGNQSYIDTARKVSDGLIQVLTRYETAGNQVQKRLSDLWKQTAGEKIRATLNFSCSPENDLFRVARENGLAVRRFDTARAAIDAAAEGEGVLLLADYYPAATTAVEPAFFEEAARKHLRLYVEFPSFLPGVDLGAPRGTHWERAVVASDLFAPELPKLQILAIHDCRFLPLKSERSHISVGRVAGFDTAVFGLPRESFPILFELPQQARAGEVLVAATKLSNFLTARYAPTDAWRAIWKQVFCWLQPGTDPVELHWIPAVRPSFGPEEPVPASFELTALRRGIDWYFDSRMVVHPSMLPKYDRPANGPQAPAADPDLKQDWPFGHRIARMPDRHAPHGDGSLGVLEGFDAKIFSDGTQPVRWWRRNDCNAETAGAMALAGIALTNEAWVKTAGNIGDWLYAHSMMSQGDRANPAHPAYGLIGWNDTPQYCGPGSMDGYAVYYGDDQARSMLGIMITAAALNTDRYDERLMRCLLANLRITGKLGFQPDRLDQGPLENAGWRHYFNDRNESYSPHYQASMWACYLRAYHQTGFDLFLQRAKTAIAMTMDAYPERWTWIGVQQERAKMLLALAWLVRVEDTPRHRAWLRKMADDLLAAQHSSGAIRERLSPTGRTGFPPPASNEAYGTAEAPLIQSDTDAATDLLYTCNFAFLALHEAAAATGDRFYQDAEDKLATFLCRIQIRSETHPELDGAWFRAFDFDHWEYWASSTDVGWGAWCIETGWSQSWITTVLALRQMKTSLWDLTENSQIARHLKALRPKMLPDR